MIFNKRIFLSIQLVVLSCLLNANITSAQSPIFTFYDQGRFGYSVSNAGDVNRDGYPDLIAGAFYYDQYPSSGIGMVSVFSGKDGQRLYFLLGHMKEEYFGISVDGCGDVNRDGFDDFVVGAHGNRKNGYESGAVYVYSGKDGTALYTFYGKLTRDGFGYYVSRVGDINKDGHDDVLASGIGYNGPGIVEIYSGKDGTVLVTTRGTNTNDFSRAVSDAGDVNKDSYPDYAVGGVNSLSTTKKETVQIFSGKDGSVIHTYFSENNLSDDFGRSINLAGDMNRDGYPDIIIGAKIGGYARAYSGNDGSTLYTFRANWRIDAASGVGDVNRDGYDDVIVGTSEDDTKAWRAGSTHVFSGKDGDVII